MKLAHHFVKNHYLLRVLALLSYFKRFIVLNSRKSSDDKHYFFNFLIFITRGSCIYGYMSETLLSSEEATLELHENYIRIILELRTVENRSVSYYILVNVASAGDKNYLKIKKPIKILKIICSLYAKAKIGRRNGQLKRVKVRREE